MRLVTTLLPPDADALARAAAQATTGWVEVRLDALQRVAPRDLAELRKRVPQRAIATCRRQADGGLHPGPEAAREALLRAALQAGFDAVDVEADARFRDALVEEARRAGVEAIVSRHHLGPASRAPRAADFFDDRPEGATGKFAAKVEGPEDLAALVGLAGLARDRGAPFAVMGLGDASLRLLAPLLGCDIVYCAPPEGPAAAPGQLPAVVVARAHATLPPRPAITAKHRLVALLGDPVDHSLSPPMQNAAFAARGDRLLYLAVRAPRARVGRVLAGLREAGFAGANVTAPLKEAVLRHADALHRSAAEARAANTLVARRGRVTAHTTDGEGALAALREAGAEPRGSRALVLGAGGTGRAVAHALARAGAQVAVANRGPAKARRLARGVGGDAVPWKAAALRDALARANLAVHATPLGREGRASPLPAGALHPGLTLLDAVYRVGGTPLGRLARARGCTFVPGEALLLHQGALAYRLWTGKPAPLGPMRSALRAAMEGS
jgi:shikimate dehydrogenase